MHSFQKDSRGALPLDQLAYYHNKCMEKQFEIAHYGFSSFSELAEIIKDVVVITGEADCLVPQLNDSTPFEHFLKSTDDHRRDRIRRVDAGDGSAFLRFQYALKT